MRAGLAGGGARKEPLIPGSLDTAPSTARQHFFLKKEAKTFAHLAYALGQRERLINKSFLLLFLKKELLPCLSQPHLWSRWGMSRTQGNLVLYLRPLDLSLQVNA
jgi:hypothetical protein